MRHAHLVALLLSCITGLRSAPSTAFAADSKDEEVKIAADDTTWDPFFVGHVEAWNTKIADYERKLRPNKRISQDADAIGAFFKKDAFEKFRMESESRALVKTVKTIRTDDDKKSLGSTIRDWDEDYDLAFVTTDALGLLPVLAQRIWPIEAVSVLRGVLKQTGYAKHIAKTRSSLSALIAKGGHIDYEERLFRATEGDRPWMIYRAVVYRVQVGDEIKSVPLYVNSMHVIVE